MSQVASTIPDYVTIGHLTIDHTPDGPRLGGTVVYSALAAARFGARAVILSCCNLEQLPQPVAEELAIVSEDVELVIQGAADTTAFTNHEYGGMRSQTIHSWGGPIDLTGLPPAWRSAPAIHLAPVAREIDPRGLGRLAPGYLGVTPQGWLRRWTEPFPSSVRLETLRVPADVAARFDGLVVSAEEHVPARELYDAVGRAGLAVITRGQQGASAIDRGRPLDVRSYPARRVDTTGAGDVFAGVLFYLRSQRHSVIGSLRLASAAAALSVQEAGIHAIPTREEVERLVEIEASRP